jgi:hypothetical protein
MDVQLLTGNPTEVLVQLGRTADLLVVGRAGAAGSGTCSPARSRPS